MTHTTEMDKQSENTAGALSDGSKTNNPVDLIQCKSSGLDPGQSMASTESAASDNTRRENPYFTSPRMSRQTIQSPVTSPHRNPGHNYYRLPGSPVFDGGAKSYCRLNPGSPVSRTRGFFQKMRTKIPTPALFLASGNASQTSIPRGSRMFTLPSRALLFAEGRRDYSARRY
ncbi:hypothetical protein BJX76DRAFT_322676 [Aspergillus varians]